MCLNLYFYIFWACVFNSIVQSIIVQHIHTWMSVWLCACVSMHAHVPAYPQAKVKKKEDIEGHIDL